MCRGGREGFVAATKNTVELKGVGGEGGSAGGEVSAGGVVASGEALQPNYSPTIAQL